ncbi:MAG: (d)CMP kinase [Candidatus Krumholzibacteriia bacterium]
MSEPPPPAARFAFRAGERQALEERLARHRDALARLVVAIDGPAGSGKSTTARAVAERLELGYLDTGATYRALTLSALRQGVDLGDPAALAELARTTRIRLEGAPGGARVLLDEEDVTEEVRSPEVTRAVSAVSALAPVRDVMLERQRQLAAQGGTVMEGRDIGTVVLPDADLKIFLTAAVRTRALRRQAEETQRGEERRLEDIELDIERRDHADSTRASAPLVCAPDAVVVDTSSMTIEEQTEAVLALALRVVEARAHEPADPDGAALFVDPEEWTQAGYRAFRHWRYMFAHLTLGMIGRHLLGLRRVIHPAARLRGSVLVACNHVAGLDPPMVGASLPFEVWWVAKRELFRNPLMARGLAACNAFPIHRRKADFAALDRAVELLRSGHNVMMFPEGTRQPPGRLGRPRWGFGYVASRAGRPVVPTFVRGTRDVRPRGVRREPLEVWVGEPVDLHAVRGRDDQETYQRVGDLVMERIAGLMLRSAARHPLQGLALPGRFATGEPVRRGPS